MAKKINFQLYERALLLLNIELIILQHLKYNLQVLGVLLQSVTIDHNVVKIYHYKLIKIWLEDSVHERVKCGQNVSEVVSHDLELGYPISSHTSNLWLISFHKPYLIVFLSKVNLKEVLSPSKLVK